jgi:hypothetical protein
MSKSSRYVKLTPTSFVHQIKTGTWLTLCGRNYYKYDYITCSEETLDLVHNTLCHKCQNKRCESPRTIKEAFTPQNIMKGK